MPTNLRNLNAVVSQCTDTTANWTTENPLIPNGIICLELLSDSTIKVKIGNGVSRWNELGYFPDNVSAGQATELVAGIVKKATDAEAIAGIENTKYITAAQLHAMLPLFATTQHVLIGTDNESIISPFTHKNFHDVDGNKLVPVTDITSNRKVLTAGENAGEFNWELAPLSNIENLNTNYTIQLSDRNKVFRVIGNRTINILSASSAGNGFFFSIVNAGTENITLDPSGLETIDSEETLVLQPGDSSFFIGDGTSWTTLGKSSLREVPWSIIQDIPSNFTPSSHKSTHSVGGTDVLSPSDIGAADQEHTHTLESLNASASNHTHTPVSLGAADRVHTHTPSEVGLGELPNSKSDSTDLNSSDTLATSMAVKTANDNALLAQAIANTKANSEHNHTPEEIGAAPIDGENKIPVSYIPNLDASKIVTGTIDIDRLPPSVIERVVLVQNDVDRFNLSVETVQAGDTIKVLSSGIMYLIIDDTKLNTSEGYLEYSAGSAASVPWTGVTNKPNSYNPSTHKNTHASGGSDALSPADIGASPEGHLHTLSSLGAAADIHTHTPTEVGLSNIPNSKSDSISLDSSTSLATSKAVKTAYDTAVSAENLANTKAESVHTHIPSEVGLGNLPNSKSDNINLDSSDTLATSRAVKLLNDAVIIAQNTANNKASTDLATTTNPGLFSPEEKIKLASIEENLTTYEHPSTHPAIMIVEDENRRFVSDTEKLNWNNKSELVLGETTSTAHRGDHGKIAYDHSQVIHAPTNAQKNSDITKVEIEAKLTGNITSHDHSSISGNAGSATKLETPRTINGVAFDGTENITIVDSTKQPLNTDLSIIAALPGSTGLLRKIGLNTWELDTSTYADENHTHNASEIIEDSSHRFVSDLEKQNWDNKQNALGFVPENSSNKNLANGYAGLDSDGKLIESVLPSIVLVDTFEASSEVAMLGLTTAEQGDICIRSDINKTFVLAVNDYSVLENWKELRTPTDAVLSVAGKTGAVTLVKADVGLNNVNNTADLNKPISHSTQTALDGKVPITRTVNTKTLDADIVLTTADINPSTNRNYISDAEATALGNISGVNTGDETTQRIGNLIDSAASKTTPVDTDQFSFADSASGNILKKLSFSNLKTVLKTYFDTLYNKYVHPNHTGDITSVADGATTIANNVVSNTKLSTVNTATIKGRVTTGSGNVEDLTAAQVRTLLNVENGANAYTHPTTHAPSIIVQDASNRFVSDAEKSAWNAKSTLSLGTTSTTAHRGDHGVIAYNHSQVVHAPTDAQKNSDITKAEIEAKLTGTVNTHQHSSQTTNLTISNATPKIQLEDTNGLSRGIMCDSNLIGFLNSSNGWAFRVDNSGNAIATGDITAFSDIRLKKDLEQISDALSKVEQLTGYTFTRIDTEQRHAGVIAQSVQKVLPEAITNTDDYLTVSYGSLVGLLVEAIKELSERVKVLEEK